jgi:hypothetical protein
MQGILYWLYRYSCLFRTSLFLTLITTFFRWTESILRRLFPEVLGLLWDLKGDWPVTGPLHETVEFTSYPHILFPPYHLRICVNVSQVVCYFQVFRSTFCMKFSSFPCMLHALPTPTLCSFLSLNTIYPPQHRALKLLQSPWAEFLSK